MQQLGRLVVDGRICDIHRLAQDVHCIDIFIVVTRWLDVNGTLTHSIVPTIL